jgi:hypothetical protein
VIHLLSDSADMEKGKPLASSFPKDIDMVLVSFYDRKCKVD